MERIVIMNLSPNVVLCLAIADGFSKDFGKRMSIQT
jgi:hypothetical protein